MATGLHDLIVWKEAAALAGNVIIAAESIRGPAAAAAIDQMVRAAESIPSNIAEGYGRGVSKDCVRFLKIARASANELESQLHVARLGRRLPPEVVERLIDQVRRVRYLIHRFLLSVERRMA